MGPKAGFGDQPTTDRGEDGDQVVGGKVPVVSVAKTPEGFGA